MMTHTSSTIELERPILQTQVGGDGNGGRIISTPAFTEPEDNEPTPTALAAEAFLIRQRINQFLNVTDACNVILPSSFREQRGNVTHIPSFEEGGATWVM